jgi:hypothetical protein
MNAPTIPAPPSSGCAISTGGWRRSASWTACGTGNFLYVTLELMKRLEGEVLEVLAKLSGEEILHLDTETVHPRNFHGIEVNARAAAIAQLVLWLGYIRWQLRNGGQVSDPVLEDVQSIVTADALHPTGQRTASGRRRSSSSATRPSSAARTCAGACPRAWPRRCGAPYLRCAPPITSSIGGNAPRRHWRPRARR